MHLEQTDTQNMWGSSVTVTVAMVTVECLEVGLSVVSKAAMSKGMSDFVFVTYSNSLACFILLPSSLIFYRKRSRPPLTWRIVGGVFVVSIMSCVQQMLKAFGLGYSSPTLASAMSDLLPAFTFILAVICRFETLDLRLKGSRARCVGTILSITGAFVVTLYRGLPIRVASLHQRVAYGLVPGMQSNWVLGGFLLASFSFLLSVMLIVQTWVVREYPAELIVALLRSIFVTLLSAIISLIAEKEPNAWKLSFNTELVAIGYSALFAFTIRTCVHLWACREKGPVFVAMFKPLGIFIAVVLGVTFLADNLYLGSLIGAATIVVGFYAVIWGQGRQEKVVEDQPVGSSEASSPRVPLLQKKSNEV